MKTKTLLYIFMLGTIALGFGSATQLTFVTDIDAYNLAPDEELAAYDSFLHDLSPFSDTVSIVILEKESGWKTWADFQQLQQITDFWQTRPEVAHLTSISNLRYPKQGLFLPIPISEPFLDLVNYQQFQRRMDHLDSYADITRKFLSPDKRYTLLFIHAPAGITPTSAQYLSELNILPAGTQVHYLQDDLIREELEAVLRRDTVLLAAISLCLILLGFYLFTQSLRGLGLIGLMVTFNIGLTLLVMYGLSIPFTLHMISIPCLITVLSFTDIMHLLYYQQREHAAADTDAVLRRRILALVRTPLLLTSLTNSVGFFIFLIFAKNIHLFHFALVAIVGVVIAYLSSRLLVIRLLDKEMIFIQRNDFERLHLYHHRTSRWFWRHQKLILPTFGLASVLLLAQVGTKLTIDSSEQEYVIANSNLARGQAVLQTHFFGSKQAEIFVSQQNGSLWNTTTLSQLAQIEAEIQHTFDPLFIDGPGTLVKRYNRYLRNGHHRAFSLPPRMDADFVDQLTQHAPQLGGDGIVDSTTRKARIVFGFPKMELREARRRFAHLRIWLEEKSTPNLQFELTGLQYLSDEATHRFATKILLSLLLSILFGSLFVFVRLKSFRKGIGVLLVNLFPLCVALGFMLYLQLAITPLTLFFLSILLGICVDDSIYLITQHQFAAKRVHILPIFITSVVLSLGFLSLACSSFGWIQPFGWVFLVGIWLAYGLDVFVLPLFFSIP